MITLIKKKGRTQNYPNFVKESNQTLGNWFLGFSLFLNFVLKNY